MKKRRMSILTVLLTVCAATFAQGLKDAYKDYFLIGVAVNQRNVTNAEQQALIKREFSSMTAENEKEHAKLWFRLLPSAGLLRD